MPEIGALLQKRYRIEAVLGRGGFGETYLTRDEQKPSKPLCVVKQLKPNQRNAKQADVGERFAKEAVVLEKLGREHDQIPELYAYFEEDGEFFLVQEYVPGKTLARMVDENHVFDEAFARKFLSEMLPVLEFIHERRVIHRDIKPENIIIRDNDGMPVLIDFGLVKEMMDSEVVSMTVGAGTKGFMPQEQVIGYPVPASDIYALGMTVIRLMTAGLPLKPDSQTGQIYWKGVVAGGVGSEIGEILDKATATLLKDRYRRAGEMLAALKDGVLPKEIRNSIGMEFVLIPAGKFWMGSTEEEVEAAFADWKRYNTDAKPEWFESEMPRHEVTIGKPFYLGKYQVTQGEWKAVMGNNPSYFKGDDRLPVESVSWDDCQEFLRKLNERRDGYEYRLPSEAEWEYACRAGTTGAYAGNLDEMGWYDRNSGVKTHAVGEKNPNEWGVYDMHGNVSEWCRDEWHGNYKGAPNDGSAWESGADDRRVLRGGGWSYSADYCRSADRGYNAPDLRDVSIGFRVIVARTK